MKEHEVRLTTTAVIWAAFTVVMVAALVMSNRFSDGFLMVFALMFTVAALTATQMIWRGSGAALVQIERSEKAKRQSRVEQVLNTMNEGELEELRTRLMTESADSEAVGLDELLVERHHQRR
jgi:hypothetical protein